ncbi:unnamed protein product [Psylliodes chrysocephalus]|uniref:Teneurin-like YD-shell domain-containing protein n=1 Tax=Psylliodes chrysocephalus TaxID=3402493 RepID=A0A9P0D223_9CUCU|nr:unnamed protein product [Psylliodes chrysocephala]
MLLNSPSSKPLGVQLVEMVCVTDVKGAVEIKLTLRINETKIYDGTALFSSTVNSRMLETRLALTIHGMKVFRIEFSHDVHGRISQTRTYTKNYTWDGDGQLLGVEAQEPWGFRYDDMLYLTYR